MKVLPLLKSLLVLILFLGTIGAEAAPQPPLANAVILIIRHAEKPDSGSGLTPLGQQRASAYIHYFQADLTDTRLINFKQRPLDHLIATADTDHSQRPRLTIDPLSKALKVPIDSRFRDKDFASLARALEVRPGGKTILICWHHKEIPALIQALGANPDALLPSGEWPANVFNWVIELRYDKNGHLLPNQARRVNEHLLSGDAD